MTATMSERARAVLSEPRREPVQGLHRPGGEGLAHGQVLHRVAGQRHLAEHHDVRTGGACFPAARSDHRGVSREITHTGIHLS